MVTTLIINGMHCQSCAALITDVLTTEVPGVQSCSVSFEEKTAVVEHDATVAVAALRNAIVGIDPAYRAAEAARGELQS